MAWERNEVEATVADYLHMLILELSGQSYNKSAHRKNLITKLNGRTDGAIELKHRNISAVLMELGFPWISGYKPMSHYQRLLHEVVINRIEQNSLLDTAALTAASTPAVVPLTLDFKKFIVDAPKKPTVARAPEPKPYFSALPQKRDYLEREARNISLGNAGEEFVLNYEHFRLHNLGYKGLAEKVEHVAKTKGDGLGYDILSYEPSGKERFIEVKTTAFGKETPFFISRGEIGFAKEYSEKYFLYRLFEFRTQPKMFELPGPVEKHCQVNPISFICEF
jgi:hypothetical protein